MARNVTSNLRRPAADYDFCFHPNVCHVCKSDDQSTLRTCRQCRMISYCSEDHRIQHRRLHRKICQGIRNINRRYNMRNFRSMTQEKWVEHKLTKLALIQIELRRELDSDETEMFLFAKSCIICHRQDNLVGTCSTCKSVDMCSEHVSTPNDHKCQLLRHCLDLDLYRASIFEQDKKIATKFLLTDISASDHMTSYIHRALHTDCDDESCSLSYNDCVNTEKLSMPLTLFHTMSEANLIKSKLERSFFIVHILTDNFMDMHSLSAWELVLHQFSPGTTLLIVLIKPGITEKCERLQVCHSCNRHKKQLNVDYHPMYYHNYVYLFHSPPDVILLFHPVFEINEMTVESIRALQYENCPVLLTAASESLAQDAIMKIKHILGLPLAPVINKQNRFASCRPYRDYESNSVVLFNNYVVMYENLLS